jgi:hypothetical protein
VLPSRFIFDTHAVVFSTDAVSLEHQLHAAFEANRINRVNARKEFFRTTPAQVVGQLEKLTESLSENHVMVFNEIPEAVEWRISQKRKSQLMFSNRPHNSHLWTTKRYVPERYC